MELAISLAAKAGERTYPNPMVGAVIVKNGKVVGSGYHRKAGTDHAEITAIKSARVGLKGAEMFVTLEPCAHYGKTPPCAPEVIKCGIKKVHIAMKDPNPITARRGIKWLESAGVSVDVGLCGEEVRRLNRKYIKFITTGIPYVTVKIAQSLDGKISARDGSSKWITSRKARNYAGKLRSSFDAIMVGLNTVLKDDPFLLGPGRKGYRTARIIVDTQLRIPFGSNIIRTARKSPVILAVTDLAPEKRIKKFAKIKGVELIILKNRDGKVPLKDLLKGLGTRDFVNILVEGGGELVGSLLDGGFIDEWMFYMAMKVLGGANSSIKGKGAPSIEDIIRLRDVEITKIGEDILIRGLTNSA